LLVKLADFWENNLPARAQSALAGKILEIGGGYTMSAIQELAPYIEAYPRRVRAAKEEKHYTISDIIERSGVSASAVNKLLAGTQMEPKLYNSAALCKVLGLSLDELFGLTAPEGSDRQAREEIHQLQLENVRLEAENRMGAERVDAQRPVILALLILCTALCAALAGYIAIDAQISNAGLIQGGDPTVVAWGIIVLLVLAVAVIAWAMVRAIRRGK
jgi:transcriptional regulator with XRE-family HTH domain